MLKKLPERDYTVLRYIHEFHAEYKNSPSQTLMQMKFKLHGFTLQTILNRLHRVGYIDWIKVEGFRHKIIIPLWKE